MKQQVRSIQLVPSSGGCFEVTLNGRLIHSKLQTGNFPDPEAILKAVRAKL